MTHVIEPTTAAVSAEIDLPTALGQALQASKEPLTVSKVRAVLPSRFRSLSLEELTEALNRQVAANVVVQFPKYRSQQDRFWDRPMPVHIANLLQETLAEDGPLAWSELRRKLPPTLRKRPNHPASAAQRGQALSLPAHWSWQRTLRRPAARPQGLSPLRAQGRLRQPGTAGLFPRTAPRRRAGAVARRRVERRTGRACRSRRRDKVDFTTKARRPQSEHIGI